MGADWVACRVLIRTLDFVFTGKGRALEGFEHSDMSCPIFKRIAQAAGSKQDFLRYINVE